MNNKNWREVVEIVGIVSIVAGLRPAFINVYDTAPWLRDMSVFQPLVELACEAGRDCADRAGD